MLVRSCIGGSTTRNATLLRYSRKLESNPTVLPDVFCFVFYLCSHVGIVLLARRPSQGVGALGSVVLPSY